MTMPKDEEKRKLTIQRISNAAKKRFENPEARKQMSLRQKTILGRKDVREKMSASAKRRWSDPLLRKERAEITRRLMSDLTIRERISNSVKVAWDDPNYRERISNANKSRASTPEHIAVFTAWSRERSKDPNVLKMMSEATKRQMRNETLKTKFMESVVGGYWYGNVRYVDDFEYCYRWTREFRERVRAFFGFKCVECGKTEKNNGRMLSVHHVYYNKKMCCDDTRQYLVSLCNHCHSKTRSDKEYWMTHFREIIDKYYGGKCWYTKDEYKLLYKG